MIERRNRVLFFAAIGLQLGALATAAHAGTFNMQVENDRIANTDRHYTNGLRISYTLDPGEMPEFVEPSVNWLRNLGLDGDYRVGFVAGQSLFTPDAVTATDLVRDDRPYAGWLYGGVAFHRAVTDTFGTVRTLDTIELNVGVVGPQALGEETQNTFHRYINVVESAGWRHQLRFEPGVQLYLSRKWRPIFENNLAGVLEFDFVPHATAAIGNVFVYGGAGLTLRLGGNLPQDFGPAHIRPSVPGTDYFPSDGRWGWHIFAAVDARGVGRNIFLDGNTFRGSHSVSSKPFVADFEIGIAVTGRIPGTKTGFRATLKQVFRTKEFDGQSEGDRFGAFSLSFNW